MAGKIEFSRLLSQSTGGGFAESKDSGGGADGGGWSCQEKQTFNARAEIPHVMIGCGGRSRPDQEAECRPAGVWGAIAIIELQQYPLGF
jgi:hypothetical protein